MCMILAKEGAHCLLLTDLRSRVMFNGYICILQTLPGRKTDKEGMIGGANRLLKGGGLCLGVRAC